MAQHENCKKFADCTWRNDVGYCPDNCNQFKHKDEVIVVRCKDCKHYIAYNRSVGGLVEWGKCRKIDMDVDMPGNGYCCYGEK